MNLHESPAAVALVPDDLRRLFILDARNGVERSYLRDWIHATWGAAGSRPELDYVSLPLADDSGSLKVGALAAKLAAAENLSVVPVRIAWQIPHFDKQRGLRLRDLILGDPRAPGAVRARAILLRDRRRAQCLIGEPATLAELRARFAAQVAPADHPDAEAFAAFVARQAALALDLQERGVRGSRYKVPHFVSDAVRTSPKFRAALERLAAERGQTLTATDREARRYMKELIARPSALFLDLRARLDRFMFTAGYDKAMDFDPGEFGKLRQTMRNYPTLLLFTHKTYIDGTTPTYLLYKNDLPMLHSFGGINLDFAGAGALFRRSGMIFIRRTFQDNPVYKLVLRHYIAYLLGKRFPMSWAFEGTRSRLGKLMPPRYGLLKYVLDAAQDAGIANLHIVPFVTSFDLIRDVEEYASEQTGRAKTPESLTWFIGYLRSLREPMGRIRVDLGEAVVLPQAPAPDDKQALARIAFDVAVHANRVTPLTVTSVICLGLLGAAPRGGTAKELQAFIRFVTRWARARNIRMTAELAARDQPAIARTIDTLVNSGLLVRHESGSSTVYAIEPAQHPIATYYRNTIVHHFLDKAIIELSLYKARVISDGNPSSVFWAETERLRDLFKFEFFYPPKAQFLDNLHAELNRTDPLWATRLQAGGDALDKLLVRLQPLVGHAVLLPYVEAYSIVFELLVRLKRGEQLTEKDCETQALQQSRQAYLLRRITSEASIGKILFQNAHRLAANFGLAGDTDDQAIKARRALLREFRELSRRMERMRLDMLANADENSDREWQ